MGHPLDSVRLKLARADQHAEALQRRVDRYLASKPYRLVRQPDRELLKRFYHLEITRLPPRGWGSLIGDCAQNIRSALDHLAFALVNRYGKVTKQTAFPLYLSRPAFWSALPTMIGNVGRRGIKREIEALQPYKRIEPGRRWLGHEFDPLWVIHRLNVVDKHRQILPVAVVRGQQIDVDAPGTLARYNFNIGGLPDDRTVIGEIEVDIPISEPQVNVKVTPTLRIQVYQVPVFRPPHEWTLLTEWLPVSTARQAIAIISEALPRFGRFFD